MKSVVQFLRRHTTTLCCLYVGTQIFRSVYKTLLWYQVMGGLLN
jgi:hypothetical protein